MSSILHVGNHLFTEKKQKVSETMTPDMYKMQVHLL